MARTRSFLLLFTLLTTAFTALADSPVTSTDFARAYQDEAIVVAASKTNSALTPELLKYLLDREKPLDVKMAVINQLSFHIDGGRNAQVFLEYALKKQKYGKDEAAFVAKATTDELLCLAYLRAMDDYFDLTVPAAYAHLLIDRNTGSYTVEIISAIILSQEAFGESWCLLYSLTNDVRLNTLLTMDMRPEASVIIFEYMDLYKHYCDLPETDGGDGYEPDEDTYIEDLDEGRDTDTWIDFPLQSIPLAVAYAQEPVVISALEAEGVLTEQLLDYLIDEQQPLDVKLALVNALGPDWTGMSHAEMLLKELYAKGRYTSADDFTARATTQELAVIAYLAATENDISGSLEYASLLSDRTTDSYAARLIYTMIMASVPEPVATNACAPFYELSAVQNDATLIWDMNEETVQLVAEYLARFGGSCE